MKVYYVIFMVSLIIHGIKYIYVFSDNERQL